MRNKRFRYGFFVAILTILYQPIQLSKAQNSGNWTIKYDRQRAFIENVGQFDNPKVPGKVLYAWDNGNTVVYFTRNGVSYAFLKAWPKEEKEENKEEKFSTVKEWVEREREEKQMAFATDVVSASWENSSDKVEVVADEMTSDYHSYFVTGKNGIRENMNFIRAYKKLIYKNLYPGIDLEYSFHPTDGLKYAYIVHPGANPASIEQIYSHDLVRKANGNIHISTLFGDIIDHAPVSFYGGNPLDGVKSSFIAENRRLRLKVDNFDNSRTLIIDPWTQTPAMPTSHAVMECERDAAGNVYIIGGEMPMQLIKYNAAGTIQWTHNTPYDTANFWLGTFATDLAGNSYVTAGSVCRLEKVNSAGTVLWQWTPGGLTPADEYWNIAFNCDQTRLIIGGTKGVGLTQLNGAIFDVNTSNGNINSTKIVGFGNTFGIPPLIEEVRSITSCRNARYYYLTLDTIGCIDDNFSVCPAGSPTIFAVNHGYHLAYKCENYRPNNGNGGIMSIRANRYFVYTQNGNTVHKRSLADGSILATAPIAGGINTTTLGQHQVGNSGLDIDTCGNVYVGSGNAIIKYNSNLGVITSTATPYKVYDVAVSTGGNVIICGATGDNNTPVRTGYVQSVAMSACNPMSLYCCDANICPVNPVCNTAAAFTLTPATPGGTWSGPGITNPATGLFDPAVAGIGTHTIVYTLPCGSDSTTIEVDSCVTLAVCQNTNGTLTVSGGTAPYTWQSQTTTQDCSACLVGCIIPPGCAVTITTWTNFATGTNAAPPGTWPIRVVDANGNITVINSISGLPFCSNCPVNVTASPASICSGQSSTLTATGATSYSWQPGGMTGASITVSPTTTTTYTVTGNSGGCTASASVTITVGPSLTVTASASPASICTGDCSNLTATGGTTYTWMPGSLSGATASVCPASTTTYTVTASNAGCTGTATVTVQVSAAPALIVSASPAQVCAGQCSNLTASGASTYTWMPGSLSGGTVNVCPTTTTTYTVTGANGPSCTATAGVTVTVLPTPTVILTGTPTNLCPGECSDITASGATTYTWQPGSLTGDSVHVCPSSTTIYTVIGSTGGACDGTANITITVTPTPQVNAQAQPPIICVGQNTSLIGTGANSYTWEPGTLSGPIVTVSPSATITYTVTGSVNGCTATDTVTVQVFPMPDIEFTADVFRGCEDLMVHFSDLTSYPISAWEWVFGDGDSAWVQNPAHLYTEAGVYDVTLTITATVGCVVSETWEDMIEVYPKPEAMFSVQPEIASELEPTIWFFDQSIGEFTRTWNFGEPSSQYNTSSLPNPSHTYSDTGRYLITLIAISNHGCRDTALNYVQITPNIAFYVPNAFTPNEDGFNQNFVGKGEGIKWETFEMYIYDRWGKEIFSTKDHENGWDGDINGKEAPQGVYAWLIKFTDIKRKKHILKGTVTLIR